MVTKESFKKQLKEERKFRDDGNVTKYALGWLECMEEYEKLILKIKK